MAAVDLIPFVLILLAFYLLIIRPARNRQKAAMQLQERLAPGVEVMTTSGMYGTVVEVDETTIRLEISPGTTVRFSKAAVGQVQGTEPAGVDDDSDDDAEPRAAGDLGGTQGPDRGTDPRDDRSTR